MSSAERFKSLFSKRKLAIPIVLGFAITAYTFLTSYDSETFGTVEITRNSLFWLAFCVAMVFARFLGYAYRLRVLSDQDISWISCFQITLLWEFASAVTPGIVGGTAAAIGVIAQEEKVNSGRSTAIVMATSFLDVLFYVLCIPVLALAINVKDLIPDSVGPFSQANVYVYFLSAYLLFFIWSLLVFIGLLIRPTLVGNLANSLFSISFLNKWKTKANTWSNEITTSAKELRGKNFSFWVASFSSTCLAWFARFALVNSLILALGQGTAILAIFMKQLIMWGVLLIPLTPGASGLAEILFSSFLGEYFASPSLANVTSIIWRLVSFYPYIVAGVIVLPLWINRVFMSKK